MNEDVERILLNEKQLDDAVSGLAKKISDDYRNSNGLILLGILKGSVVFLCDLMKKLYIPAQIEFMRVSSYGSNTISSGRVKILLDVQRDDLSTKDIIVVEDIIDSGRTLSYLTGYLKNTGAKSVKTCTLLDKPSRREVDFKADYVGVEIPDEFVVGYGLDYNENYRTLPYVGVLKRCIYDPDFKNPKEDK